MQNIPLRLPPQTQKKRKQLGLASHRESYSVYGNPNVWKSAHQRPFAGGLDGKHSPQPHSSLLQDGG
jgi:hypothetical protein